MHLLWYNSLKIFYPCILSFEYEREMKIYAFNFCPRKQDMKEDKNGGKKGFLLFLKFLYRAGFVHIFNKYTLIL